MTGVVGIDLQRTWSAVVLTEYADGQVTEETVGDGSRGLIPNAYDDLGRWGSTAANAAGPQSWLRSPWTSGFLGGVRSRLEAYLGGVPPIHRYGYRTYLCVSDAPDVPDTTAITEMCLAAGLTDCGLVDAGDALVCRWLLGEGGTEVAGASLVVTVDCGEGHTSATPFHVELSDVGRPKVVRLGDPVNAPSSGIGEWNAEFVRTVVDRCQEGVDDQNLLAVLDGVIEFATQLRQYDRDRPVEWMGPFAERMYTPLRVTAAELAGQPAITALTGVVRDLVADCVSGSGEDAPLVLLGGAGAVWPFLTDALGADTWCSRQPHLDFAAGATWWPALRTHFAEPGVRQQVLDRPRPSVVQPRPPRAEDVTVTETEEQPPWLR